MASKQAWHRGRAAAAGKIKVMMVTKKNGEMLITKPADGDLQLAQGCCFSKHNLFQQMKDRATSVGQAWVLSAANVWSCL